MTMDLGGLLDPDTGIQPNTGSKTFHTHTVQPKSESKRYIKDRSEFDQSI